MSIDGWKKMPRKQQELVFGVWEKVLGTIKFQAATKKDFMGDVDYPDMLGPKDTPFDTALKALRELCGTPRFFHGCPGCVFLGTSDGDHVLKSPHNPNFEATGPFDLYFCDQKRNTPTLTVRFKDAPRPTDKASGLSEIFETEFGQDAGYLSEPLSKEDPQQIFLAAKAMAMEVGLVP